MSPWFHMNFILDFSVSSAQSKNLKDFRFSANNDMSKEKDEIALSQGK